MQLAVALLRCGARGSIERHPSRPSHQFATELMERANNKQINHVAVAGWMCVPSTVHTRKKRANAIACARIRRIRRRAGRRVFRGVIAGRCLALYRVLIS